MGGIRTRDPSQRSAVRTHALDCAATETGIRFKYICLYTRVGALIVANMYLQLTQNRYRF